MSKDFNYNYKKFMNFSRKVLIHDKDNSINTHIAYMLNRTQKMFTWSNLPESIPERILELYLQTNGNVCFYRPNDGNDSIYVFTGGLGGEPDVYYRPTLYTIANPALNLSKSLKIDVECVVMPNDSLFLGLLPMFSRYASLLSENELSINLAIINTRIISLITASDDRGYQTATEYLKDIEAGKPGIISDNPFLESIKVQPYAQNSSNSTLTNLIEAEQYIKASWYNEIGLNANYNMKRESLNMIESQMNYDALLPLVDDMLSCRQQAAERVNNMFGLNISVNVSSSWKINKESSVFRVEGVEDIEIE